MIKSSMKNRNKNTSPTYTNLKLVFQNRFHQGLRRNVYVTRVDSSRVIFLDIFRPWSDWKRGGSSLENIKRPQWLNHGHSKKASRFVTNFRLMKWWYFTQMHCHGVSNPILISMRFEMIWVILPESQQKSLGIFEGMVLIFSFLNMNDQSHFQRDAQFCYEVSIQAVKRCPW